MEELATLEFCSAGERAIHCEVKRQETDCVADTNRGCNLDANSGVTSTLLHWKSCLEKEKLTCMQCCRSCGMNATMKRLGRMCSREKVSASYMARRSKTSENKYFRSTCWGWNRERFGWNKQCADVLKKMCWRREGSAIAIITMVRLF